jgi:hypothetical protein
VFSPIHRRIEDAPLINPDTGRAYARAHAVRPETVNPDDSKDNMEKPLRGREIRAQVRREYNLPVRDL